ncbi:MULTISPECIES: FecR family protein [unclassified Pedobacter]|uniref:FecR family protein n=1 Tax=unclassified Pedobacter TaxID=2628915 RepID=UPI0014219E78|nr:MULTISPECIES: FecR domain-containing protein [unclassified Pedobacter]NII85710.1 ferric-dicitrate binding protein FerR (iron transport regulator) [Pedobacter sp. SG908]NMN39372.1 ferric-dicitrate binding protein FerR (iron transport regulator) [Pedobacter sp. SG918]
MDKNYTNINDDLLAKYLLGEATVSEIEQVEAWAASNLDNRKQLEDFKTILEKSKLQIDPEIDEQQALARLNARLETEKKTISYTFILRWVAVVFIFFSAGLFFYNNLIANKINVNSGESTLTQALPDGSTAILNKQSALSFVGGFFNKTRDVKLKGEAFFKVSADKSKPFIISVNDVQVTVVGTAFNVKSNGKDVIVIVESGIVKVNNQNDSVRLTAGERVEVSEDQRHLSKGENQGKLYNYYYSNELVCDGTPLNDLVAVLNEKFKSNIVIVNPALKSLPISTTFKNESLKEILNVIAETFKIKIEYGQGIIKLK